jgi:hypothetical protein
MSKVTIDLGKLENSCFVAMPFNDLYQTEYETVISPTLEELNIKCIRGDEIYAHQRIMDDIWTSIRSCRFMIAELTGRNPNVLYEVGLAHAIGKPVIIITRNSEDVPFDLKDLRYLFYDINDPYWGEHLKKGLKSLVQKVIENPGIEKYLPGISKIGKSDFPAINPTYKKTTEQDKEKFVDVSGEWTGSWMSDDTKHTIILNLSQNRDELSATANVSYYVKNQISVVQQIMTGKIIGLRLRLMGVNYSYIERAESEKDYLMDIFDLDYDQTKDILSGTTQDSDETSGPIILNRLLVK